MRNLLTLSLSGAVILSGCAVGPNFEPPAAVNYAAAIVPEAAAGISSEPAPDRWWTLFGDPVLNDLEARAMNANLDIKVAQARVAQSRAALRIAGATRLPSVGASAAYARERDSDKGVISLLVDPSKLEGASPAFDVWQGGFDASWEIDLWGRARRMSEAASAGAEASAYDLGASQVAVSAELARAYVALRGVQANLIVARDNLTTAQGALRLASNREVNGVATRYDRATAQAQVETIRALIPALQRQESALFNAIAMLLGQPPRALQVELNAKLPVMSTPAKAPLGLSSQLLRRRPDILAAEARLHAATAEIGVAKADFYPTVNLTGRFGFQALDGDALTDWSARQFAFGPTLSLPLFQGGRLKGRLALNKARQQEVAIDYQRVVLRAWQEVDDALVAFQTEQQRSDHLAQAVENNQQALRTAERRYEQGADGYLAVLIAQRGLLSSQTDLNDARTAVYVAMVALYKALGASWADPVAA